MTTFCGDDLDFQNEVVLGDTKFRVDMPTVVSDAKLYIKQENSPVIESRNVPYSDAFAPEGDFSGCPVIDDNRPNLFSEDVDVENKEECFSSGDVSVKENGICEERDDVKKSSVSVAEILDVKAKVGEDMGEIFDVNAKVGEEKRICEERDDVKKSSVSVAEILDVNAKVGEDMGEILDVNAKVGEEKRICEERDDVKKSSVSVAEILDVNAKVGEDMGEILDVNAKVGDDMGSESLARPFHFLVKVPRLDNSKTKQVEQAKLLVEEKTRIRNAFRLEIHKYKANCREHAAGYDAAVTEARAAKRGVKSKRAEIDALQSLISKVKNALSVEEIDTRIANLEHMIEHETMPLKEEKHCIREIKQLKQLREQLCSNIGGEDEVQQALNNRGEIEERLKALKKELDGLKGNVLKAEALARTMEKTYEVENKKLKEVQDRFKAADSDRQDAYKHMQSLKREMDEKDDVATARKYAVRGETEALHKFCVNQVESTMELWNKDVEFREEYVRCNMSSTHRRLGTCDGLSLGPLERVDQLVDGCFLKEAAVKSLEPKTSDQEKSGSENVTEVVSGNDITDDIREKEHLSNKEELEVATRDEEQSREDSAAKLKEQRRLEEKSKALEALERKKKNVEKAQMRAELRAQKEAEQREKEREKRLRKKDKKKFNGAEAPDANNLGDVTHTSELATEILTEPDTKETAAVVAKKTHKPSVLTKQSKAKSIPPPLRNRGRKKLQQWIWVIVTCLVVVLLFLVGNIGFFSSLSNNIRRPT